MTRPISLGFILACVALIALLIVSAVRQRNKGRAALQESKSAA